MGVVRRPGVAPPLLADLAADDAVAVHGGVLGGQGGLQGLEFGFLCPVPLAHLAASVSRYAWAAPAAATEASSLASSPGSSTRACVRSSASASSAVASSDRASLGRAATSDDALAEAEAEAEAEPEGEGVGEPEADPDAVPEAAADGDADEPALLPAPNARACPATSARSGASFFSRSGCAAITAVYRPARVVLSRAARARARSASEGRLPPVVSPDGSSAEQPARAKVPAAAASRVLRRGPDGVRDERERHDRRPRRARTNVWASCP